MTDHFQRVRWSPTRRAIDAMKRGAVLAFPPAEYANAKASVDRCNDAYEGRKVWEIATKAKASTVTRTK